jgi:hypothetical protein
MSATKGSTVSKLHRHTDDCLQMVDAVPNSLGHVSDDPKLMTRVPPGWFRCNAIKIPVTGYPYWVHAHGARYVSHFAHESKALGCAS